VQDEGTLVGRGCQTAPGSPRALSSPEASGPHKPDQGAGTSAAKRPAVTGLITAAKHPVILVPRHACQRPGLNSPCFAHEARPSGVSAYGIHTRELWENVSKPSSLPIVPLEQHPGSELGAPSKRCDKDEVTGSVAV